MRKFYFSLYELTLLSLLGALTAVMQVTLRLPLHIPGHTGIYLVIPIILGAGIVKKPGAAAYVGLIFGILSSFSGTGNSDVSVLFRYLAMGIGIDIAALLFRGHLDNIFVGLILGAVGNLSKMIVMYYIDTLLGIPQNILIIGIGTAAIFHLTFGGLGGIISAALLNRLYRTGVIRKNEPDTDRN
jgi:hypothetical protein